jgi:hypothetical protein
MFRQYFQQLRSVYTAPGRFFEDIFDHSTFQKALMFAALTGVVIALELGLSEVLESSSLGIIALVTVVTLFVLPLAMVAGVYIWSGFTKLCAYLLKEELPYEPLLIMVGYSAAGFLFLGLGGWVGKFLSLAALIFQVAGMEKMMKCSRWTAVIFVFLPFSIFMVCVGFFTLMFKVF